MCGRYEFNPTKDDLRYFESMIPMGKRIPSEEVIYPGTRALLLTAKGWEAMDWSWKMGTGRLINARAEGMGEKKIFQEERCIVPANAWYEWDQAGNRWKIRGGLFLMAGLWRREETNRFVIITRSAQGELSSIHRRMPFLLNWKSNWNNLLKDPLSEVEAPWEDIKKRLILDAPKHQQLSLFDDFI